MNELTQVFSYSGQEVRTLMKDNEVWFVAKDVCEVLELSNPTIAISRLDRDEVTKFNLGGLSGDTNIVNEAGLYSLILGSRKREAKKFKRWITHEVLPSIRKHGAYMTENTIEKALTNPDFLIQLATTLKQEQQARKQAETRLEEQQPLVNFAETCMKSDSSLLVREVAKLCSKNGMVIGEKRLWQRLRDWGLVFKNKNEPKQEYVDRGYFEISQGVKETSKGALTWMTMRITPKGQTYIVNRLKKEQLAS